MNTTEDAFMLPILHGCIIRFLNLPLFFLIFLKEMGRMVIVFI